MKLNQGLGMGILHQSINGQALVLLSPWNSHSNCDGDPVPTPLLLQGLCFDPGG